MFLLQIPNNMIIYMKQLPKPLLLPITQLQTNTNDTCLLFIDNP